MDRERLLDLVRNFHENGFKWLLSDGRNVRDLLALAGVEFAAALDVDRVDLRPESFIKGDFRHLLADAVVRAPFRDDRDGAETWFWIYVLVEHQDRPDWAIPLRLLDVSVQGMMPAMLSVPRVCGTVCVVPVDKS